MAEPTDAPLITAPAAVQGDKPAESGPKRGASEKSSLFWSRLPRETSITASRGTSSELNAAISMAEPTDGPLVTAPTTSQKDKPAELDSKPGGPNEGLHPWSKLPYEIKVMILRHAIGVDHYLAVEQDWDMAEAKHQLSAHAEFDRGRRPKYHRIVRHEIAYINRFAARTMLPYLKNYAIPKIDALSHARYAGEMGVCDAKGVMRPRAFSVRDDEQFWRDALMTQFHARLTARTIFDDLKWNSKILSWLQRIWDGEEVRGRGPSLSSPPRPRRR